MPLAKAIGQALLKGLAGEGLSINGMISIARQAGGGYRYQEMRNDANKYLGRIKYQGAVESLRPDTVVPQHLMIETELNQPAKYMVHGFATVYTEDSDTPVEIHVSFYTDDMEDETGLYQQFTDFYGSRYQEEGIEVADFKRRAVEHNAGWDY